MRELEQYLGTTYNDSCQSLIMVKTKAAFTEPDMPTIITDTDIKHPKTDVGMIYLKKNSIGEAIHKKLRKKDVYETKMDKIYNLTVKSSVKLFPQGRTSLPRPCHNTHSRQKPARKSGVWVQPTTRRTGVVD